METSKITTQVVLQLSKLNSNLDLLGNDHDTVTTYDSLLQGINKLSPLKWFQLGIDLGINQNILILTFEQEAIAKPIIEDIISEIELWNDEHIDWAFPNSNTLIAVMAS